jgi:hypothetical protein
MEYIWIKHVKSLFSLFFLCSFALLAQGQEKFSLNAGIGFVTYEEAGTTAMTNDILVYLVPKDNFRSTDFAPVISIFAGVEMDINAKSSLELQLEYYQIISSFIALDTSAPNLPMKVSAVGIPYLNANAFYRRGLFKLKKLNVGVVAGLTHQTSLKNNFDTFISNQAFEQRTWNILGEVPKSIKRNSLLYSYGAFVGYERFKLLFMRQAYFSQSFTSDFEFEGELVRFNASRTLHRLEMSYQFKTLKNKRTSK